MTDGFVPPGGRMLGVRDGRLALGTIVTIQLPSTEETEGRRLFRQVFEEILRIEKLLTAFDPESDVGRLNHGGRCDSASPEILEVLRRAILHSELSGGAFDVTASIRKSEVSKAGSDDAGEPYPDYRSIQIEGDHIRFAQTGMAINLGAIAKGYAVDRAIAILLEAGVERGLVNAGGDLRVIGGPPTGDPWTVGIRNPRRLRGLVSSISLGDQAVATSGSYQRPQNDIVNPNTGQTRIGILSASVVADTTMDADALATSVYVLGPEKGGELIEGRTDCAAMWVMGDGMKVETSRWKELCIPRVSVH